MSLEKVHICFILYNYIKMHGANNIKFDISKISKKIYINL